MEERLVVFILLHSCYLHFSLARFLSWWSIMTFQTIRSFTFAGSVVLVLKEERLIFILLCYICINYHGWIQKLVTLLGLLLCKELTVNFFFSLHEKYSKHIILLLMCKIEKINNILFLTTKLNSKNIYCLWMEKLKLLVNLQVQLTVTRCHLTHWCKLHLACFAI